MTVEALSRALADDASVRALLEHRTEELGDKPFIRWGRRDISYQEMDGMANAVANGLLERGIGEGARLAMMMGNSPEWIAVWLGAAKVGAITVTLNTAHKGEGLGYLLRHSNARALFIDGDLLPRLASLSSDIPVPQLVVSGDPPGEASPVWAIHTPLSDLLDESTARPPRVDLAPRSACSILYTSGTTGPPKGCLLPNGQYLAAAHLHAANCGYGRDTTVYTCLPLFHINAQNYSLLSVLAAGGTLAIDAKFSASRFWERVVATEATAFNFIGAMALALWNREPTPAEREHRANVAFGVPVPASIWPEWEARFRCRVIYAYGMTENALPAIFPIEDTPAAPHLRGAAGKASPTAEVQIVDEQDYPVPAGTVGEIVTRPKIPWTMMTEYVDRPDATVEAFRNCWFHTGDLGYLDEDGFLFYADRKKDALRRRGEMVSSWEVEAVVTKFPGVAECAVVGVPSEMTEDDILIVVVCEDEPIDPAELIAHCEQHTAKFQVPRYVRIIPELPRTQTQRVEKYRLREQGITEDTYDGQGQTHGNQAVGIR